MPLTAVLFQHTLPFNNNVNDVIIPYVRSVAMPGKAVFKPE